MPQLEPFATEPLAVLPPSVVAAVESAALADLDDQPSSTELANLLRGLPLDDHETIHSPQSQLCMSGLWLLAGDLDRSHTISQDMGSNNGSFWHGIMHRREGDFGNAKYWFRRVGQHPVFDQLTQLSGGSYNDPFEFVDQCSRAKRGSDDYQQCQRLQWLEWQALMVHCLL